MYKIRSERLMLIAATRQLCLQEQSGILAEYQDLEQPPSWPPPHVEGLSETFAVVLEKRPEDVGYLGWYWCLLSEPRPILVGFGGFKGKPDDVGLLEIGYAVLDEYHGQGIATEAVGMLIRWSMQFDDIMGVCAHVEPHNTASRRVLKRNRFTYSHMVYNEEESRDEMLFLRSFTS